LIDLQNIRLTILQRLRSGLDPRLTYHGVHHTEDVVTEALRIAAAEKVTGHEDLLLLNIASLFHDSGFLYVYKDHEERGCRIAEETLPAFGINSSQLERIKGMIMATKIPQSPHNFLEEIICDADLDYLGREDFYPIGKTLFAEWKVYGFVQDEEDWNRKQVGFLEMHHYFTPSSIALRGAQKEKHLEEIKSIIAAYKD
jgi:uncharacterized protein